MCWQASIFFTYFVMSGAARQKSGQWLSISKKWLLIKQSWLKRHSSSSNICVWTETEQLLSGCIQNCTHKYGQKKLTKQLPYLPNRVEPVGWFSQKKPRCKNYDGNFHLFELCKMQIGLVSLGCFYEAWKVIWAFLLVKTKLKVAIVVIRSE